MTVNYSDPKLLAQIALTQMVQSCQSGITTARSTFKPDNINSALKAVIILNEAFGSVSNACFSLDQLDGSFVYTGPISLHIPELLRRVKNEESIYDKATGSEITYKDFKDIIKQIELTDLSSLSKNLSNSNHNPKNVERLG